MYSPTLRKNTKYTKEKLRVGMLTQLLDLKEFSDIC